MAEKGGYLPCIGTSTVQVLLKYITSISPRTCMPFDSQSAVK